MGILYLQQMTVFLVINSLYGGGAEHVASRLSKVWDERYDLKVISLDRITEMDYNFSGEIFSLASTKNGITWFGTIKNYAKAIDELAEVYQPSVIVSFLQNSNLAVLWTKYKAKKIVSVRNYLPRLHSGLKLIIWNFLIKRYYPRADYVVSVSQMINDDMIQRYKLESKKCVCIYNPYSINDIRKKSKEQLEQNYAQFFKDNQVLSCMGNLSTSKGHFHLLRMMKVLKEKYPNMRLCLLGFDKGRMDDLKQLAKELNVDDISLFAGHQTNPWKFLSKSWCFVFPSLFEGFPNALLEAMICGIPVISTDCKSGPKEILEPSDGGKFGLLMDDDMTEWLGANETLTEKELKFIKAIEMLIENKDLYDKYSKLSYERACDFDIERIAHSWDVLFN